MGNSFFIPLNKVPPEGLRLYFTPSSSKEWESNLKNIIGTNDYNILIFIKPLGDSSLKFQVTGHIQTHLDLICSRCAVDFKYQIDKKISERLCIQPEQQNQQPSILFDANNEEDVTLLNQSLFNLYDFVHELIAIEEPMKPVGKPNCELNDDCENFIPLHGQISAPQNESPTTQNPSEETEETHRPFSDLDKFF